MGLSRWNKAMATVVGIAAMSAGLGASQADAVVSWHQTAQRVAAPWPAIQTAKGTFPAYNYAKASGFLPYGESMLGYGLLQSGLAGGDRRQIGSGLRAIGYASRALLRRGSPSVFENLALAASY